jgi:adenine-specific DNA-methyltransferase
VNKENLGNILSGYMSVFVRQNNRISSFVQFDSWIIMSDIEMRIKDKVESIGTPLKNWDIQINYGIKTGFNDAFIITDEKRKELIEQDPKSEEIIRPILRGRDIHRYGYDFANLWIIVTHNGSKESGSEPIRIEEYPSIKQHLDKYYEKLAERSDKGVTPYNLRNCAYMDDFYRQKIVWGEISDTPNFALDNQDNYFINNKCYLLTGSKLEFLVCYLNSPLSKYTFSKIATTTGVGTLQWSKFTIEQLPIPVVSEIEASQFKSLLSDLKNGSITESVINQKIYSLCNLSPDEVSYIETL